MRAPGRIGYEAEVLRASAVLASSLIVLSAACGDSGPGAGTGSSGSSGSSGSGGGASGGASSSGEVPTGTDGSGTGEGSGGGSSTSGEGPTSSGGASSGAGSSSSGGDPAIPPDCPRVKVVVMPGNTLNVRPTPSTAGDPVGSLANGAIVDVVALVHGEVVDGSDLWFEITSDDVSGFVFSGFVMCTLEEPPELQPPAGYYLPLECGSNVKIAQGNFGAFSHQGKAKYAYDFSIPLGTPLVAMADGIVQYTYSETDPGDPCYDGGGPECFPYANMVLLFHGDGTDTIYKHLNEVWVSEGEFVKRGTIVGLSGSTGYSTGPHAHCMRMENCGEPNCQSIPLVFVDVGGDGEPETGEWVTSMNCP